MEIVVLVKLMVYGDLGAWATRRHQRARWSPMTRAWTDWTKEHPVRSTPYITIPQVSLLICICIS